MIIENKLKLTSLLILLVRLIYKIIYLIIYIFFYNIYIFRFQTLII